MAVKLLAVFFPLVKRHSCLCLLSNCQLLLPALVPSTAPLPLERAAVRLVFWEHRDKPAYLVVWGFVVALPRATLLGLQVSGNPSTSHSGGAKLLSFKIVFLASIFTVASEVQLILFWVKDEFVICFCLDVIVGGASIGSLALLAWMVEGYCEDPWVCAWRGGLVWATLPRALNSKRKCLSSCLSSDEWRAALLPLLESSQASNSGTQDLGCFQFGVFGLFKKKKHLQMFSRLLLVLILGKQLSPQSVV